MRDHDAEQADLFPPVPFLDADGFLNETAIRQLKEIEKHLKERNESLETTTFISRDTWRNWMYRRRKPHDTSKAFLSILLSQPDVALNILKANYVTNSTVQ